MHEPELHLPYYAVADHVVQGTFGQYLSWAPEELFDLHFEAEDCQP